MSDNKAREDRYQRGYAAGRDEAMHTPSERERALEAALLSLVDDIESIHDALDIDELEWADIMDRAMGARYMALAQSAPGEAE